MTSIFEITNISDFVAFAFEERQKRNQNYSLGSFARDLEISKSILSDVITGKKGLRLVTLTKIIKAKNLNTIEDEYLKCIWVTNFSKSKMLKDRAKSRIEILREQKIHTTMDNEQFNLLQDWYILPVFELVSNGQNIKSIGQSLYLKAEEVKKAIDLLLKHQYLILNDDKTYSKFNNHIKFESPVSADVIKNYHRSFLDLSSKKLYFVPQEKRKYLTSTITIPQDRIPEARNELESFLTNFITKYSKNAEASEVYTLALQFYNLSEELTNVH